MRDDTSEPFPHTSILDRPITLLGVWAHPDDESYLSATAMRRVVRAGGRVVVVSATRGELGGDAPPSARRAYAARREAELRSAMRHLGVHEVVVLGLPDGACHLLDPEGPTATIGSLIAHLRPHVTLTFGPDGITNHPDHQAVHAWTAEAWRSLPRHQRGRLLYATMTESFVRRHHDLYPDLPLTIDGDPVSVADHEVSLRLTPDAVERHAKQQALAAHASQTEVLASLLGQERFDSWWHEECFRDAAPLPRDNPHVKVMTPSSIGARRSAFLSAA